MRIGRGLIFAAIHLAIAIPIIISLEISDFATRSEHHPYKPKLVFSSQETGTVMLDPCGFANEFNRKQGVVVFANLPAFIPTEWSIRCPSRWTVAGILGVKRGWAATPDDLSAQRKVDALFILLIALQWFLIGSFPLKPSARFIAQPEWFITITSAIAAEIVWITPIQEFCRLPALLAFCGWVWFVGLLLWRIFKSLWHMLILRTHTQRA
jgi:hypothetical protein